MDKEQVRKSYAPVADLYIELFGNRQQVHRDDLAFIGRHLAGRPGAVLDLGCGPGHITDYLRELGVDATGIDMVPEFIDHARVAYQNGTYEFGSVESLDAADHSVAGLLAWYSLIHLAPQDLHGVLRASQRYPAVVVRVEVCRDRYVLETGAAVVPRRLGTRPRGPRGE